MISKKINKLVKFTSIAAALSFAALAPQSASAAGQGGTFFGNNAPGKWIIGAKAGRIDTNIADVEEADAVGIVLGYEFARAIGSGGGSSTVELEFLSGDQTNVGNSLSYEADILNLFFTYRSPGKLYYKLKGGLSYASLDINAAPAFINNENEDVSLAAGIGLGYRVGDIGVVELEYSADSGDSDFSILGINALLEF